MPPFLPRKHIAYTPPHSPGVGPTRKRAKLTETLDAEPRAQSSLEAIREFSLNSGNSESSLSDVDSDEFEDLPSLAKAPVTKTQQHAEDDDVEWEDAIAEGPSRTSRPPLPTGDLQLTFPKEDMEQEFGLAAAASGAKKGLSRREREVRMLTHRLHVQFLLYHNAIRNNWTSDKMVQDVLVKNLPEGVRKEVDRWRVASGLISSSEPAQAGQNSRRDKRRGKPKDDGERNQRDWGRPSQRLEKGKPDLSRGDPIIPLMKVLSAYWKKRYAITAPGLRKRGYGTKAALHRDIASYHNDPHHPEKHGERIRNRVEFREAARAYKGSRDLGAQLFTALLRGLGIESRMVASLQPGGFGFTKAEQAEIKSTAKTGNEESPEDEPAGDRKKSAKSNARLRRRRVKRQGDKDAPIDLDTSSVDENVSDNESVIDLTPALPAQKLTKFDRDLLYPIYWTEAVSPISHIVFPVSPLVLQNPVATTPEMVSAFEPRGAKADKAKQVMAYVVAYSSDGTAKDVTTRYLKRRMWPGKTKGFRVPVERIPVRDARGKVKRYEEYDWFKTMMSGYVRTDKMRTAVDDVEDSSDLVPQQPEKRDTTVEGDTLQSLKASAVWVLERFLRREEALKPNAKPDRMFIHGKGDKLTEEPVYRRADVERCLTAESWHKDGRRPKAGAVPLKQVPIRAMTLTRKREVEEAHRQTGEMPTQGLYSWDQTEYIIPEPIKDGVIPKNAYGNIDCFVPTMIPKGAVHLPMRGTVRICKKLEIDYAEAVTGFEFGKRMAIPVITGVVVAKENEKAVREAWRVWDEEQRKKEEGKLEKAVLALWRKFVMGLRINERVQEAYRDDMETHADLGNYPTADRGDFAEVQEHAEDAETGGGFLLPHEDESHTSDLVMEHQEPVIIAPKKAEVTQCPTPLSLPPNKTAVRKPLQQATPDSSELTDISAGSDSHESLTSDSDVEARDVVEDFASKSRTKTRQAKTNNAVVDTEATAARVLRRRRKNGATSPYFRPDKSSAV